MTLLVAACGGGGSGPHSSIVRVDSARLGPPRLQQIGDWNMTRDPSLKAAVAALGRPTSCRLLYNDWSFAEWRSLGVNALFTTLGGLPKGGDACSSWASVYVDDARLTGRRWHTVRGLRIGDTTSRLRALYPQAKRSTVYQRAFWTIPGEYWTLIPRLIAETRGDRVVAFIVPVGAQGD